MESWLPSFYLFLFIVILYTQELWLAEKTWHLAQILVSKTERERDPLSLSLEVSICDRIVVFFGLWFLPCSIPFDVTISSRSTTSLEWTFKSFVFKKIISFSLILDVRLSTYKLTWELLAEIWINKYNWLSAWNKMMLSTDILLLVLLTELIIFISAL